MQMPQSCSVFTLHVRVLLASTKALSESLTARSCQAFIPSSTRRFLSVAAIMSSQEWAVDTSESWEGGGWTKHHSPLHRSPLSQLNCCNLPMKAAFSKFLLSPTLFILTWHWPQRKGYSWSVRPAASPAQDWTNQVWPVTLCKASAQLDNGRKWLMRKAFGMFMTGPSET